MHKSFSQGTRLQVSIPLSLVSKWRDVLVQFQMYIMTNFVVVDNQKDMIGKVVGKEDPKELITTKGKTKRLAVILEDLENNRIGCTIFGKMVDQLLRHMQDGRVEPLIVVVQYYKANK
ncbi:hypothetical protein AHAS_Ahas14G0118000 [Arachis hypogaea]